MDLVALVQTYERSLEEARVLCEKKCVGRENCFKKCLQREREKIRFAIEEKYGVRVEVI